MFQLAFADPSLWQKEKAIQFRSRANRRDIVKVLFMQWEEHCVECGFPDCYSSCSLYKPRKDGHCARFAYGILPNHNFNGHFDFGADIRFKKWAKLEAKLAEAFTTPLLPHSLLSGYQRLPRFITSVTRRRRNEKLEFDDFILECYSPEEESFKLLLEYFTEENSIRKIKFRFLFEICTGYNSFSVPFEAFNMTELAGYISLFPEKDQERRLIFTWLDFVRYKKRPAGRRTCHKENSKKKKIKCVAWDLDNTIWRGTLIEDSVVRPRQKALQVIKKLDEMGIIQTVVSKNDFEMAWCELKKIGIDHYFLFPAINWGQKSENLIEIAKKLNIDLNSFAVIDDSPFERSEISRALPQVNVYKDSQMVRMLEFEEFDVPVTSASTLRRISYVQEESRNLSKQSFSGSYDEFLISCNMVLEVFCPEGHSDVQRCWELIQRSNQLNLSSRRFSESKFNELLQDSKMLPVAFKCRDRFGDYGIVGYMSICFSMEQPIVEDFVLSCRVAQKKVEHSVLRYLSDFLCRRGYEELSLRLTKTPKNGPLLEVFTDLGFEIHQISEGPALLRSTFRTSYPFKEVCQLSRNDSLDQAFLKKGIGHHSSSSLTKL